jgi:hypothetical protein
MTRPSRTAALTAALAILIMAGFSGWANVAVIEALVPDGEVTAPADALLDARSRLWLATGAMVATCGLDVVAALGLWAFFRPAGPRLAAVAAGCRVLYVVPFGVAIAALGGSARAAGDADADAVRRGLETFHAIWGPSLAVFGIHLILVGWIAARASYVPRWLGPVVALGGAGYLVDGAAALTDHRTEFAVYTFGGEVVLMAWLLVYAVRRTASARASRAVDGHDEDPVVIPGG